jgi:hypothetical protein
MLEPRITLVTCADLPDGDEDDALLVAALQEAGARVTWAIWDDPAIEWAESELVLIRSPWDYTFRSEQFVAWTRTVPGLVNPAALIGWNADKRYLQSLADHGVRTVPTTFVDPGGDLILPRTGEYVVKPSVGAGSRGAGRFDAGADDPAVREAASAHAALLHQAGRTVMIQPYLSDVDIAGESGLIHFGGEFSHAIRKAPMLAPGAANALGQGTTHGLFEPERITARTPNSDELLVAQQTLAALGALLGESAGPDGRPAYARVDRLPTVDGPVLIELELVEPSLFLSFAPPEGIARFAELLIAQARMARR